MGGSSCSEARPRSSRNWRVVASSAGRPQMQTPVLFAQMFVEETGQLGVGNVDPAARGYAVGYVGKAFGEHFGKVGENGSSHQVGVDFRHAVDFVRTDDINEHDS